MTRAGQTYILCEAEDKIFQLTATGAKFRQRGRLDDIERRLAALEGKPAAAEPTKDDKDDKDDIDNDDDENRPFIEIVFGDDEDSEDSEEADADEDTE